MNLLKGSYRMAVGTIFLKTSTPHSLMMTYRTSMSNADGGTKGIYLGCPRNEKKFSLRTETNWKTRSVLVVFRFVSWNQKLKISICFSLFQFVSVFWTYIETTETYRTVSKQTKTTQNFLKNTKICSLLNCFSWSSVCFGSIKTSNLAVSV